MLMDHLRPLERIVGEVDLVRVSPSRRDVNALVLHRINPANQAIDISAAIAQADVSFFPTYTIVSHRVTRLVVSMWSWLVPKRRSWKA